MSKIALALGLFFSINCSAKIETVHLTAQNTVVFSGEINQLSIDTITAAMVGKRILLPEDKVLYLLIASEGGLYNYALVLQRFLKVFPGIQIICRYCASAAGFVFASYENHDRLVNLTSELIMHEMFLQRVTADMVQRKDQLQGLVENSDAFNEVMRKIIGISKEEYNSRIIEKNWSVKGAEIVKLKLADRLVNITCDSYMTLMAPITCNPPKGNSK